MTLTARYADGMLFVSVQTATDGFTFVLTEHMTVAAIEKHLRELAEYYG